MAIDIARAWKDPEYRKTLTPEELASLPPNPAGEGELTEQELENVSGGRISGGISGGFTSGVSAQSLTCTVNTVCP